MEDENQPVEENEPEYGYGPTHSPRTWRTCCLAPAIAVGVILLLTVGAGLFSPQTRLLRKQPGVQDKAMRERREAFIRFGRSYFAIARKADEFNEKGFRELDAVARGNGSIEDLHAAFRDAAEANGRAAAEFKMLIVPHTLQSRLKIRQSLNTMSMAYDARKRACEILVAWNGDTGDQATAEIYRRQVEEINRLTMEGLKYLGDAAGDNGLTRDDVQKFLPAGFMKSDAFRTSPILR